MSCFRRWQIDRISVQITIVVVIAMLVLQTFTTIAFVLTRDASGAHSGHPDQIVALARLLNESAPADRALMLQSMRRAMPALDARLDVPTGSRAFVAAPGGLRFGVGGPGETSGLQVGRWSDDEGEQRPHRMAVRLRDGDIFSAKMPPPPPMFFGPWTQFALFVIVSVVLLVLWASATLTRPLRAFERAAQTFADNVEEQPLAERGPREIRTAAAALNRMQARVKALIFERTRMLAALSHDLRTPLTRIRLRAEFVGDASLRQQLLGDVAQMRAMVEQVLVYLRDGSAAQTKVQLDLASILEGVCHEFSELGHEVVYDGPDRAVFFGNFDALQRAFTNLIDNAVRYGGSARVGLARKDRAYEIEIVDAGPGLAAELRETAFEPFVRGDDARGMDDTTGFGLGLPIARAVVQAHGGAIALEDAADRMGDAAGSHSRHGLRVRIMLPFASEDQTK